MTADSYSDFLEKLREALENKQKQSVDYLLEYAFSGALAQDEVEALEDIISEATLYLELGEDDYRETAIKYIDKLEEK
ncbi:hypothetical protein GW846_03520 [Candidatus Gracilibacteria bacterium]|nr:hypothetical protein [Candidatus Gracilibacteria bacterium]